jgi:hypothetical protein
MSLLPVLLSACLILNEVLHNPLGPESGAGSAGDCREFVELTNTCDTAVSLVGLTLTDNVERDTLLPWQDTALAGMHPGVCWAQTGWTPGPLRWSWIRSTRTPPVRFILCCLWRPGR